ncbi:MAG: RMD1 family protein [Flavobacteriales bacterium]|nr:RMD1 family protein [Flavobacteriales bacterium]
MTELIVNSYITADKIDLDRYREITSDRLFRREQNELFFIHPAGGYYTLTNYGVAVFLGIDHKHIQDILSFTSEKAYSESVDNMSVIVSQDLEYRVEFDKIYLDMINAERAEIILIETGESAALHHYKSQADHLLEMTREFISYLELKGRLKWNDRKMKVFIGRTLNLKSKIAENLYLFDTPPVAWHNEFLNQLDVDLNKELEIHKRYRALQDKLDLVTENLSMLKDLMQHRHSSALEWIIILLILIEVIHMVWNLLIT